MDAVQAGIDPEVAQATVGCVTRFATGMCVIIAVVKVGVYIYSGAAAVKTSALDSIGDLVANCITLYTGYRMNAIDEVNFPVGQARFEPIGVLVFSTLMASAMMANALNNVEDLLDTEEQSREDAIQTFFNATFGTEEKDENGDHEGYENAEAGFAKMAAILEDKGMSGEDLPGEVFKQIFPKNATTGKVNDDYETAWDTIGAESVEDLSLVWQCADLETLVDDQKKTYFTMAFLAVCAVYKLCLWQYCVQVAIPRSASSILVALASDKRNDCVATSFVITCMLIAIGFKEQMGEEVAEKIDPACSLILSLVIVYTWVSLMIPQMTCLSGKAVEAEVLEPLCGDVQAIVRESGGAVDVNSVKCYKSSAQNTVEVELAIPEQTVQYHKIDPVVKTLYSKIGEMEDVERILIVMPSR
jgi:divalent metal cation (Fe/Co/Zn/Cd) transporter